MFKYFLKMLEFIKNKDPTTAELYIMKLQELNIDILVSGFKPHMSTVKIITPIDNLCEYTSILHLATTFINNVINDVADTDLGEQKYLKKMIETNINYSVFITNKEGVSIVELRDEFAEFISIAKLFITTYNDLKLVKTKTSRVEYALRVYGFIYIYLCSTIDSLLSISIKYSSI